MAAKARGPGRPSQQNYRDTFLKKLKELSGRERKLINNRTLKNSLGWDDNEDRYTRVKNELAAEGKIYATRGGPGGAVSLSEAPGEPFPEPLQLFISYSHHDEDLKNELVKHLRPLIRKGLIAEWHDRKIGPGETWAKEIDKKLGTANIYILLVSIDFINSSYCYDIEMDTAIERASANAAEIVPVIARSCMWKITRFEPFHALPIDGKAISTWPDRDEALTAVVEGVRQVAERLMSKR